MIWLNKKIFFLDVRKIKIDKFPNLSKIERAIKICSMSNYLIFVRMEWKYNELNITLHSTVSDFTCFIINPTSPKLQYSETSHEH